MRFFIDNNLSNNLARGMSAFGEEVDHLTDHFPEDAQDTDWLQFIGNNNFYLITRDDRVRRNPAELHAFKKFRVGAFFMGGKNRSRCQLIQQLIRNWPRIKECAEKTPRPFAYRIPPKGTKFVKIGL